MLLITEDGRIMNVDNDGIIDCKASNDDGIIGGTLSPTQEYLYVVTKNKTLLQLDEEYDMIK